MAESVSQRANRVAFGHKYGKGRSNSDSQLKRESERLESYREKKSETKSDEKRGQ